MANGKKKSKKKIIIFSVIGVALVALIFIAFLGGSKEEIIAVQTEKVQKRTITQTVSATGKIDPEFKVVITPEVTGEIVSLPVKEGDRVKKGENLIQIKGDIYVAQRERAEANLQSAKATLAMRNAELERVKSEFNRLKELHSKGLSSDAELETIQSNYLSTEASYNAAEANVLQSQASLKEINEQIYKTSISSPMNGVVTQLNVELGERVLGSGFSQGTNIMTVADLNNIEAVVEVDENDVVLISAGDTARVKIDAFGDRIFRGVVSQIGNSAITSGMGTQEQVVNFEVKIKLIDLDEYLRPGMSCTAEIETETINNIISIPIQSVTARTDLPQINEGEDNEGAPPPKENNNSKKIKEIVFIIDNGKAKSVEVETGISDDNYIVINKGLNEGDEVVSGSYRAISRDLKDGSTVRVENNKSFGA